MRLYVGSVAIFSISPKQGAARPTPTLYGHLVQPGCYSPTRIHRAGYADSVEAAQEAVGSVGNPVIDVAYSGDVLTVTYSDGSTEDFTIAAGGGGGGVDQTARDAAATAQTIAEGR